MAAVALFLLLALSEFANGPLLGLLLAFVLATLALCICLGILLKGWKHAKAVTKALGATGIILTILLAYIQIRPSTYHSSASQGSPPGFDKSMCTTSSEGSVPDGWGPDRPSYTDDTYPPGLTFNSTSTNTNIGDERNFVGGRKVNDMNAPWRNSVEAMEGQTFVVRAYIRLDGPSELEASDVTFSVNLPTCMGHRIAVSAILSDGSYSAYPAEIWDGMSFWSRKDFNLRYVPDSAALYNNANPKGTPIPERLFSYGGAKIGYESMDGKVRPGYKYASYLTFEVAPQFA